MINTVATAKESTPEDTKCMMCGHAGNRYRGKWLMCFGCYADSVE